MQRIKGTDIEHYGGQGGAGYFSLKNDHDVARVRFMYNGIEDVSPYVVHQVDIGDKKRYVNCLREYNQPLDDCPFCRERKYSLVKLFIPVYNVDDDKVQVWERGKKFYNKFSSMAARYPDLVSHEFEIERIGQKGDTNTTYEIYEVGHDDTTLEDLPEQPNIIGGVVMDKSAEDMEYYLESGQFPPEDNEEPVRRRGTRPAQTERVSARDDRTSRRTQRRTPANRGEEF